VEREHIFQVFGAFPISAVAVRIKIRHYRQLYTDRTDPVVFLSVTVSTSGRVYDDFVRLILLHEHREASILVRELSEESDRFRFLRAVCLPNLKGCVGLILAKVSGLLFPSICLRVTIPIDLSTGSFIPVPRFFNFRRAPPLLNQSLVLFPQHSAHLLSSKPTLLTPSLFHPPPSLYSYFLNTLSKRHTDDVCTFFFKLHRIHCPS